jgi:hypothetical protein
LNTLYQRHVIDITKLKTTTAQDLTEEEKKAMEAETVFAFKDPRLRHLNKDFKREELQVNFVEFAQNEVGVQRTLDEIIKFNCMCLEFNFMHDVFHQVSALTL